MTDGAAIRCLQKRYRAPAMVQLGTPEDTLIATLLTARTRDEQVLAVYSSFRKRFPTLQSLANATPAQIARSIASIGLFRNKSRAIHALAKKLLTEFGGIVPNTMEELIQLPGVGRKTASCVLWYGFGIPAVAVDVHVFRIAHRLGWAIGKTPEEVERELRARLPRKYWGEFNRVSVQFGRELCKPQRPHCVICPLREACPFGKQTRKH
jgi:endonuclease-3